MICHLTAAFDSGLWHGLLVGVTASWASFSIWTALRKHRR